jgi:thermitase
MRKWLPLLLSVMVISSTIGWLPSEPAKANVSSSLGLEQFSQFITQMNGNGSNGARQEVAQLSDAFNKSKLETEQLEAALDRAKAMGSDDVPELEALLERSQTTYQSFAPMVSSMVANQASALVDAAQGQFLVKFKMGKLGNGIVSKYGLSLGEFIGGGWYIVKTPSGKAAQFKDKLLGDTDVESAELDYIHVIAAVPNDPNVGQQWHLSTMSLPKAWDISRGSNTVIAVLDTGVAPAQPDLKSKLVLGASMISSSSTTNDAHGHGTHVSGIAAAIGNNAFGGTGVDQSAKIMPVKVLSGTGSGYASDIIRGVYFAVDHGAKVLLMPFTSQEYSQAFQDAIHYAWAKNSVLVAAAGNDASTARQYPAGYVNVLSVAATTQQDMKTSFSNYGNWVDVAAPGQSIYATDINGGYTSMSGTSMASAAVAGLVSLAWGKNPAETNSKIVNRIFSTVDQVPGSGSYYMYGRVNAYKTLLGF